MKIQLKLAVIAIACGALSIAAFAGTLVDQGQAGTTPWNVKSYNPTSISAYGAVTLAATTATKIPTSPIAHGAIMVQNRDTSPIYCGSDANVTNVNGIEVLSNASISIPLSYNTSTGTVAVYCYSVAGQSSTDGNGVARNTRYWETL